MRNIITDRASTQQGSHSKLPPRRRPLIRSSDRHAQMEMLRPRLAFRLGFSPLFSNRLSTVIFRKCYTVTDRVAAPSGCTSQHADRTGQAPRPPLSSGLLPHIAPQSLSRDFRRSDLHRVGYLQLQMKSTRQLARNTILRSRSSICPRTLMIPSYIFISNF